MNFNKFVNSDYLKSNPLCGIGTYKDELNLATGACTRKIKKLVLTGDETDWQYYSGTNAYRYALSTIFNTGIPTATILSTNFEYAPYEAIGGQAGTITNSNANYFRCWIWSSIDNLTDFQAWLKSQYNNGTPVTVWYVLAEPTTETITVPSGLSGTEEGYLNQSGTPTPTSPIYPTANTVEKWFDINHYIMGTDTDTLTTLPADLYADGTNATVGLVGNMSQTGTPTPATPIQPQECGERTGNLLASLTKNYAIDESGNINSNNEFMYYTAPCEANETYTFSLDRGLRGNYVRIHAFNGDTWIEQLSANPIESAPFTVTTPVNTTNLKISITKTAVTYHTMLNLGSTALPYEPYGIKIPILSNSTTTPVYLGEVESTRNVAKYVFTGQENWQVASGFFYLGSISPDYLRARDTITYVCTHYTVYPQTGFGTNVPNKNLALGSDPNNQRVYVKDDDMVDVTAFKTYLQQQYSAGTPVCVWYVLATPQTAVVNEPLRKIGDYADEVSGITIPTTAGGDTLSVDTTLQPSEVTVNYKGWHPVQSVHERENGAWD